MLSAPTQLTIGSMLVVLLMGLLWLVQRQTKNAGIVDVAWAGSIGCLGVFFAVTSSGDPTCRLLVGLMISLWSLRLTAYLYRRVVGRPEEGRYARLRQEWPSLARNGQSLPGMVRP